MKMNILRIKNLILASAALAALTLAGCAKSEKTEDNEAELRYLEAWVQVNHPDAQKTELGAYIIEDTPGKGETFEGDKFAILQYNIESVDGTISATTDKKIAQQIGKYNKSYYYGNVVWAAYKGVITEGVLDVLKGMKIGGTRRALIPSWLFTYSSYKNAGEYYKKAVDNSSAAIYTITLNGLSSDILKTQVDSMEIYTHKHLDGVDSTSYGFYYKQLAAPSDTSAFPSDTSIYINYTGRLLNGQVFDTTIADTAKFYNVYSSSSKYEPRKISWGEKDTDLRLYSSSSSDGSEVVTGFSKTLWQMRAHEKGVGVFFSSYGYQGSGSGSVIPAYSPLVFEIEIVDKP